MGYTDLDQLAINTIRVLAVSRSVLLLLLLLPRPRFTTLFCVPRRVAAPNGPGQAPRNFSHGCNCWPSTLSRPMPPSRPTRAILEPPC